MLTNLDLVVYRKILFYKRVKWFKTFFDKIKALIVPKDSKIYFCNKFILSGIKFFMLKLSFVIKMGYLNLIQSLTLSPFFPSNIN